MILTQEQEIWLKENHLKLKNKEIEEYLKISSTTLNKIKNALKLSLKKEKKIFSQEEINFIKDNYSEKGATYCSEKLNRKRSDITSFANQKLGLKISRERKLINCSNATKIYRNRPFDQFYVNPQQFIDIKTPEVAYLLGFLWADGCVTKNRVEVNCEKEDMNNIEHVFMKTGKWKVSVHHKKQKNRNAKPQKTFRANITQLAKILLDYGYKSKSTESADTVIEKIPSNLLFYFFRGLLDGDGYVRYKGKKVRWEVTISSSYEQDWTYMEKLCKMLNITYRVSREKYYSKKLKRWTKGSVFHLNKYQSKIFLDYIYQNRENDKIGLNRKYQAYKELYCTEIFNLKARKKIILNIA